jgi:hypothetical protein
LACAPIKRKNDDDDDDDDNDEYNDAEYDNENYRYYKIFIKER